MSAFLTLACIHLLAVMSPGPDLALITRYSIIHSRRAGIAAAGGLALGILVHVTYSLLGIAFIISRSILLFNTIKYLGAGYLLYVGWHALFHDIQAPAQNTVHHVGWTNAKAMRSGFLCNVLNPKVTLFFLAVFTQIISPATPLWLQIFYGLYMSLATFTWFCLVSMVFSSHFISRRVESIQTVAERLMGGILIALGIKVAFSARH